MKAVCCLFVLLAVVTAEKYTDKYDDVNIEEILENRKLFMGYVKCVLEEGPCTPEGRELKAHFIEGVREECLKCTDRQKINVRKVIKYLINKEAALWEKVKSRYDPDNKLSPKYEQELKE